MYKAFIFDWDGTLVDTCGLILDAHNHVRAYYNLPLWTMDDFLGRASKSAREYYPEVYGDNADKAQEILYDFVEQHHLKFLKPIKGAKEIIERLIQVNIPVGIVSNKRHDTLLKEIEYLGWSHYFDVAIGAGFADKDKPSKEPLCLAIKAIDNLFNVSDILYVGDTETDLMTAQNTQSHVAFIPSDKPRPDLIERYAPQYSGSDITSVLGMIIDRIKAEPTLNKIKA